jgi:hypothetical protein
MRRALSLALSALLASGAASAAFYVDEEAPVQTAATAQPTTSVSTFDIPFYAKRGWLSQAARRQLGERLTAARAAEDITITVSTVAPNTPLLAKQRGESLKQWFVENGVPASKVAITDDGEPRPRDEANTVNVTMTVRNAPPPITVAASRPAAARFVRPPSAAPVSLAVQAPQPLINDQTKIALLQRIVAMGKNKIVKPEEAFALVAEVLNMQDPAPAPAPAPTAIAAAPMASPMLASLVAADVPRQWTLDDTKTLRANLEDWARIAGWEVPAWQVSSQYRVSPSTIPGTFYDALAQLATAVPSLDFAINKTRHTLRVSESAR